MSYINVDINNLNRWNQDLNIQMNEMFKSL